MKSLHCPKCGKLLVALVKGKIHKDTVVYCKGCLDDHGIDELRDLFGMNN